MDARSWRGLLAVVLAFASLGASYRSPNFIVSAPSPEIAERVGQMAEKYRNDLAIEWLGKPMPNWARPCPVTVQVDQRLGAGGVTSFVFDHGEVFGWQMSVQGPLDRVLDSVLPHEVTHTIFASHFRRPLPRWADEGACTTVEHTSERSKQQRLLVQFLKTNRGIPFSQMYVMKEYPRDILPLYSQGHSLSTFLMARGGKQKFLAYIGEGLDTDNWVATTEKFYGYRSLAELQDTWLAWVQSGSPQLPESSGNTLLVSNTSGKSPQVLRGQSPDSPPSGEPQVIAPLVSIQRPLPDAPQRDNGTLVAASTVPAKSNNGWLPAGSTRTAGLTAGGPVAPAPGLPGPNPSPVTMQVATPPSTQNAADGPSVYAVRPRSGDTLLR